MTVICDFRYPASSVDAIESLRQDLPYIRAVAGWSQAVMAEKLELSTATYSLLENTPHKMTTIQYYAICRVIEDEIEVRHNGLLQDILNLLNSPTGVWYGISRNEFIEAVRDIERQVGKKVGKAVVAKKISEWTGTRNVIQSFPAL